MDDYDVEGLRKKISHGITEVTIMRDPTVRERSKVLERISKILNMENFTLSERAYIHYSALPNTTVESNIRGLMSSRWGNVSYDKVLLTWAMLMVEGYGASHLTCEYITPAMGREAWIALERLASIKHKYSSQFKEMVGKRTLAFYQINTTSETKEIDYGDSELIITPMSWRSAAQPSYECDRAIMAAFLRSTGRYPTDAEPIGSVSRPPTVDTMRDLMKDSSFNAEH